MSEILENEAAPEQLDCQTVEIVGVNFRDAGTIYYFSPRDFKLEVGQRVIVETARGVEMGTVKLQNKLVDAKEIVSPLKDVTRPATKEDILHDENNHRLESEAEVICKKKIAMC